MSLATRTPKLWRLTRILGALARAERMRRMSELHADAFPTSTRQHRCARAERLWSEFYAEKRNPSHMRQGVAA